MVGRDGWLINESKGCGGVMRVAPLGLVARDPGTAFGLGSAKARLTHGHPSGYLSAGHLAALINGILAGLPANEALSIATALLKEKEGAQEVQSAVEAALQLAGEGDPTPDKVETLGGGWIGEEALAIGLY